ncbi:M56 family metallopeptidase [Flavobacterium sp.]|uniref:M56 family metallopeptidase n=1 Tax=Flavobacterium sp. TaxID=239 RepID=UPI00286E778F|nr:M56 family metallopeptidase [Flavobacterium sp.]
METIFIYVLKSSALIAVFYLSYYFLIQKETFFNSNRWFLLSGLFTSVLLPLFFIKKIVFIEKTPIVFNKLDSIIPNISREVKPIESSFDWIEAINFGYFVIAIVLLGSIIVNVFSLFKLLYNKKVEIKKPFALVDINENISPFSFFRYIVFNSKLYSKIELESILNHEKVHSLEKHSIDVIIVKVFCAVFWFNPFVWLYKKAILQNLEYIADQKAIQNTEDKKAYQMTLLKVVTDQNCLSITNNFYQSLIKKRIVMLNKNQSKQRNVWKYALIIPALVAFVIFFQVKVIAQEKTRKLENAQNYSHDVSQVIVCSKSTDEELKNDVERLKTHSNIDLKFSKVKRNKKGEITAITVNFNDNNGSKGTHKIDGDTPIDSFKFSAKKSRSGKYEARFYDTIDSSDFRDTIDEYTIVEKAKANGLVDLQDLPMLPAPPTPPTPPDMSNMPAPPTPPNFPTHPNVKTPTNPNDKKGWQKFEADMEKFAKDWENSPDMKKFEAEMKAYESKMEEWEPDMTAFEKEMEKFEAKMEAYQDKMEAYQESVGDENQDRQEAIRDRMNAKRDEMNAKRDAINAKRDEMKAKRNNR